MQYRYHEEHDFELRAHSTPIPHSLAGSGRQDSWDMEGTVEGRENGKEGKRKDGKGKGKKRQDSIPVLLFSTSSRDNNN